MSELTLESLARRLAALERKFDTMTRVLPPTRNWQSVVGISEETEFSRAWQAEMKAIKDAERQAAMNGIES